MKMIYRKLPKTAALPWHLSPAFVQMGFLFLNGRVRIIHSENETSPRRWHHRSCSDSRQLIFRRSSIFRHVAVFKKYLLALAGQLQLTGCQVVTHVGSVGMDLALSGCNERR